MGPQKPPDCLNFFYGEKKGIKKKGVKRFKLETGNFP